MTGQHDTDDANKSGHLARVSGLSWYVSLACHKTHSVLAVTQRPISTRISNVSCHMTCCTMSHEPGELTHLPNDPLFLALRGSANTWPHSDAAIGSHLIIPLLGYWVNGSVRQVRVTSHIMSFNNSQRGPTGNSNIKLSSRLISEHELCPLCSSSERSRMLTKILAVLWSEVLPYSSEERLILY
jgi:hypothetical protein